MLRVLRYRRGWRRGRRDGVVEREMGEARAQLLGMTTLEAGRLTHPAKAGALGREATLASRDST